MTTIPTIKPIEMETKRQDFIPYPVPTKFLLGTTRKEPRVTLAVRVAGGLETSSYPRAK